MRCGRLNSSIQPGSLAIINTALHKAQISFTLRAFISLGNNKKMYRRFFFLLMLLLAVAHADAQTPWSTVLQEAWLQEVMPAAESFSDKRGDPPVIHAYRTDPATGEETLIGYIFTSADYPPLQKGYSAPIDLLIGLGTDGELSGIKVLNYVESYLYTRGDFLADPRFQRQFRGKNISDEFRLRHDLDGVSSATISSWAIARSVRSAARQVASAYLGYSEADSDAARWAANAHARLEALDWQAMLDQGLLVQGRVATPLGEDLELSIAYMGHPVLGEILVGADNYAKAERDASIRFDTPEIMLVVVGGDPTHLFRQDRISIRQGDDPPRRVHPSRLVNAGLADAGVIAGRAEYATGVVLDNTTDLERPFTLIYQAMGSDPLELTYQLSDLALALSRGEPILSPEELWRSQLADAGLLTRLRHDPPWGETSGLKLGLLLATLALVMAAFLSKNSKVRWTALSATLIYLGFVDSGFLSVSHINAAIMQGPAVWLNNLPTLILIAFTLVTTLLWGRVFCSSLCPFGAVQDIITRLTPKRWRVTPPKRLHQAGYYLKYAVLALILITALLYSQISIFQYFEPFGTLFFFSSSLVLWAILVAILIGSVFISRFYCRYLCPLGAALAVLSVFSLFRIKRVSQCNLCKVCENSCPTGAIELEKINFKECVRCDLCESKLIEKAGACRHSPEEINRRKNKGVLIASSS